MKTIEVLCGLIFNSKNKLLITRRCSGDFKSKWEFPGGKLEKDETEKECLKREILEELNIEINVKSFFMRNNHSYPNFTVELISYISLFNGGEIKLVDHDKYEWVEINQLKDYNFLDGDIPIIDNIIDKNINPSS
tara:strand:- start:1060 stop:1464 length:405 start_codon:yes stop_codon:yes gene_type:complete